MTVVDYINRKNDITEKYTGIRIVPEDQIVEVKLIEPLRTSAAGSCPYCQIWSNEVNDCEGCPMSKAGNECELDDSSYAEFISKRVALPLIQKEALTSELNTLVREFNATYNFKQQGE